jgi:DeoR family transcriptional regulator of aga operon
VAEDSPHRVELFPAQRRARILDHLQARGSASVAELAGSLEASAATIRRDIEHLTERGYVVRAHGGVMLRDLLPATFEPEAAILRHLAGAEKQAIGDAAAALVEPGQSVVVDSGTTTLAAARAIARRAIALTVVTNDLAIAQMLGQSPGSRVIVTGGTLRPGSDTLLGEPGEGFLGGVQADIAFLGAHAVSGAILSDTSVEVARTKLALMSAARRVVLLVDGSKFRERAFFAIAGLDRIHAVVTDATAPAGTVDELRRLGIEVTVAGKPLEGGAAQAG